MYGLPKNFTGAFFIGQTLRSICFNANQVYLGFHNEILITIESSFSHQRSQLDPLIVIEVPVFESHLMELVEHLVTNASGNKDGTLTLEFDNGHIVKIFDNLPNYECYHIKHGDDVIIV